MSDDVFVVTQEWLHQQGGNGYVGWSARQLAVLGVGWPPRRGWLRGMVGKTITLEQKAEFERIGAERRAYLDHHRSEKWKTDSKKPREKRGDGISITVIVNGVPRK